MGYYPGGPCPSCNRPLGSTSHRGPDGICSRCIDRGVTPTCCDDADGGTMVALRGPRRLWGLLPGRVIGYACAWCGREADAREPVRQAERRAREAIRRACRAFAADCERAARSSSRFAPQGERTQAPSPMAPRANPAP